MYIPSVADPEISLLIWLELIQRSEEIFPKESLPNFDVSGSNIP
jgi:hypothetical protein